MIKCNHVFLETIEFSRILIIKQNHMEGDQSKNSVCYLEISYSTLDSVSLLILNINNVLL